MRREIVKCSKISVDCVYNDPVDIKIGGPECLGFDFFVKNEEVDEMQKFIKQALLDSKVPLISIGVVEKNISLNINQVWDKARITKSIVNEANYLINQSKRNCEQSQKTKIK